MTATQITDPMSPDVMMVLGDPRLAAQYASGALILAMRDRPPRVVFASAAAAAVFGADDLQSLNQALMTDGQPGGLRLIHLARTMEPDRPARLERLRFFFGGRSEVLDFECRTIATPGATPRFVAVCGTRRSRPRRDGGADLVAAVAAAPARSQPPGPHGPEAALAPSSRPMARRGLRFLWETDANHLATNVSADFTRLAGARGGLVAGGSFPETARRLGADPDGCLARLLSREATFSGLDLEWPSETADAPILVRLAGQPMFDAGRRFTGYRGFGVMRDGRTIARSQTPDAAVATAAAVAASGMASLAPNDAAISAGERAAPPRSDLEDVPDVVVVHQPPVAAHSSPNHCTIAIDHPSELSASARAPETHRKETVQDTDQGDLATSDTSGDDTRAMRVEEAPPTSADQQRISAGDASSHSGVTLARPALSNSETDAFDELANLLQARLAEGLMIDPAEPDLATDLSQPVLDVASPTVASPPVPLPDDHSVGVGTAVEDDTTPASVQPGTDIAAVMERLPMGVLVTRGGAALYANRTLLDLLGHADLDAFHQAGGLDHTLRGRDPGSLGDTDGGGSISIATASGEILNVDGHLQAMNWGGAPATLMSFRRSAEVEIARRVGGLRQKLTILENETAELHAILDTATDGVAVLDKSGIVLSLNRSAEALFGLEQGDVVGEPFTTLMAPESHGAARDYLDGLKKSGVASLLNDGREVIGRAGRRGIIPLFMTLGHLPQRDETRFCAVMRDLTPWKRAERDLQEARRAAERASQMKSDFLARVSHEIRTPMNAILGFAEVIVEERFGAVGNERYKEYLHDIHASGVHVMNIVNDLLDLSKIEAGKMELTFASVDANKIVADCVALMQPQAYRERVIIRMALAPRLPNVVADERSLRQIVLNILSNAVNFNEAGGQVIVSSALTDGGSAVLRIRDTGIGMSDSDLEAALEPFRQLPTARKGAGTGLGLPLTKALADANRASFTIKSKKNEGTLVEIAFPSARVLTG